LACSSGFSIESLQKLYSFPEGYAFDHYDQIDGIEVLLATKTAGQVGLGMAGG
jgi:hypothetical protein